MSSRLAQKRRKNGWSIPLASLQILSWFIFLILIVSSTIVTICLPIFPFPTLSFLFAYFWIFCCVFYMTSTDPGFGNHSIKPISFIRETHQHVIENDYCNICQIQVPSKTKHCRYCNKCILGFDHHCKWLNNCIGRRNYKMFIVMILSIIFTTGLFFIVAFIFVVIFVTKTANNDANFFYGNQTDIFSPFLTWRFFDMWVWFIVSIFAEIVHLIVFGVTLHLYRFHVMLWKKGMTTYSYIMNLRTINIVEQTTQTLQPNGPPPNIAIGKLGNHQKIGDLSAIPSSSNPPP